MWDEENEEPKTALEALRAGLGAQGRWESKPYDGILGKPPDWVPEHIVNKFRDIRSKLLTMERYPLGEIRRYIEAYPERLHPGVFGVTPIPREILDDISWLCLVKEAAAEDPKKGLPMLVGNTCAREIVRGRNNIKALSQKDKRKPVTLPYSNKTIKDVIRELVSAYPNETAKELWDRFFGTLDELGLKPVATDHPTDLKKCVYEYDIETSTLEMAFGTFANIVSSFRVKK